jgi:hypothetical protein
MTHALAQWIVVAIVFTLLTIMYNDYKNSKQ